MNPIPTPNANIMLVDDTPANLAVLEDMLNAQGYRVRCFPRGRLAIAAAMSDPPDLVLLDINMPEMNGYEVCQAIKADPQLASIPVIFVSAMHETSDQVRAFSCGGVDYVTKPFRVEEVLARVRTHLELRRLQHELEMHNARLDELVRLKTHQLADAHERLKLKSQQLTEAHERLTLLDAAKNDFLNVISHELRTPLNGIFSVSELLFESCPGDAGTRKLLDLFRDSRDRLFSVVEDALLLTQITVDAGAFPASNIRLDRILQDAAAGLAKIARERSVWLGDLPTGDWLVRGETILSAKALRGLLQTAVKLSQPGETVRLSVETSGTHHRLIIDAFGRSLPDVCLPRFFQVLAIAEAAVPGGDLGLAAPLARRILRLFGGEVTVANRESGGVRFSVAFEPAKPAPAKPSPLAWPAGSPSAN